MKTKFEDKEFVAMLASAGILIEVLVNSKNYQEMLNHPDYTPSDFTLTDASQGIHETAKIADQLLEERLLPEVV